MRLRGRAICGDAAAPSRAAIGRRVRRDADRLAAFARRYQVAALAVAAGAGCECGVELVLNLTNPRAHIRVTRACLAAGKHVYSEKPLGMTTGEARRLAEMAEQRDLSSRIGSVQRAQRNRADALACRASTVLVGQVRVVYANFDDGMIAPHQAPWTWTNDAGVAWPAKDEFEVGSTYQHAGYVLTWLCAMFGPARRVHSFASVLIPRQGHRRRCHGAGLHGRLSSNSMAASWRASPAV